METDSEAQKSAKKRGRPYGIDQKKLAAILKVLAQNPEGLWLRKTAKKAGVHPTTVSNYVDTVLRPLVSDISLGSDEKPILRVIRLKTSVIRRIENGASLSQLLHLSDVVKNIGKTSKKR